MNLTGRCTLCRAEKEREAYTIPPVQDGDDDPAVHVVMDRSSRSTLPEACLGALCGRRAVEMDGVYFYGGKRD